MAYLQINHLLLKEPQDSLVAFESKVNIVTGNLYTISGSDTQIADTVQQ